MEKFEEAGLKAKKNLHIADHMLTQTYPLIKDPKLLLAVMENVFLSLTNAVSSLLYYERFFQRIPPFQETFDSKFNMFKMKCAQKYKINLEYLALIQNVKEIIVQHKNSPIEFSRKDTFVICNGCYKVRTINVSMMKDFIKKTKLFIQEVDNIVVNNDRLLQP